MEDSKKATQTRQIVELIQNSEVLKPYLNDPKLRMWSATLAAFKEGKTDGWFIEIPCSITFSVLWNQHLCKMIVLLSLDEQVFCSAPDFASSSYSSFRMDTLPLLDKVSVLWQQIVLLIEE